MRKYVLFSIFMGMIGAAGAQTSLSTAVDFTVTDLEGHEHTLFDYLNDGKYVCIDFFAYWCGPCQTTAPQFTQVFHEYGCNDGEVIFLSVEYEGSTAQTETFETSYSGNNPPPAVSGLDGGGGDVHATYGIQLFPTYILIAPDQSIVEQDIWPMSASILAGVLDSYGISQMECSTSVDEASGVADVVAFPVPAKDVLQVQLEGASGISQVTLYSIVGERVLSTTTAQSTVSLDVSELENGHYILSVESGSEMIRKKITVMH
ncbi:MAG: redoxin domain-containing protein [Flavobacteriales bacterium]|nr:redoxin domain-containing protein [Flavobacteriales bacterium]